MKRTNKIIALVIAVLLIVSIMPTQVFAQSIDVSSTSGASGDFEYKVLPDGTAEITGYKGDESVIDIPEALNGYKVTSIASYAFSDYSLTSITIPDSVTSIGWYAFCNCESLTSITIPDSVTSIGSGAFSNTGYYDNESNWIDGALYIDNALIEVNGGTLAGEYIIRDGTTVVASEAFCDCTSLTSITIPDSVTSIGWSAFYNCESLTSITIPDSVTSIGAYTFYNCDNLTSITIPNSVTSIGYCAFSDCTSLTSITIPDSVTNIGEGAFYGTPWYNNLPDGLVYINNVLYNYKGEMPENTHIDVKKGTVSISSYAFSVCNSLTSIIIPDSVKSIGYGAFIYCDNLTSITIPDSVISVGDRAFYGCSELKIYGYEGSYAQTYAQENAIPFVAIKTITDTDSGISVNVAGGSIELNVTHITDNEEISDVDLILDDESVEAMYDITLTSNGVEYQPETIVEVKIPTDNKNAKVYCVEEDATLTDMNAEYIDGYMVFKTEHFSKYIVAVPNESKYERGDVNLDGIINILDATELQKHLAQLITLDDMSLDVADVNGDGYVSILDATLIQKYLAQLVTEL